MASIDVPVALMGAEIREQPGQRRNASGFGCDSTRAPASRRWRRPSWSGYTIGRDWGYWENPRIVIVLSAGVLESLPNWSRRDRSEGSDDLRDLAASDPAASPDQSRPGRDPRCDLVSREPR